MANLSQLLNLQRVMRDESDAMSVLMEFLTSEQRYWGDKCRDEMLKSPPSVERAIQYGAQSVAHDGLMGRLKEYIAEAIERQK